MSPAKSFYLYHIKMTYKQLLKHQKTWTSRNFATGLARLTAPGWLNLPGTLICFTMFHHMNLTGPCHSTYLRASVAEESHHGRPMDPQGPAVGGWCGPWGAGLSLSALAPALSSGFAGTGKICSNSPAIPAKS